MARPPKRKHRPTPLRCNECEERFEGRVLWVSQETSDFGTVSWASDKGGEAGNQCPRCGSMSFCEVHGREAEAAALAELAEDTEMALGGLEDAEQARLMPNPVLVSVLQGVQVPTTDTRSGSAREQDNALRAAYPPLSGCADPTLHCDDDATRRRRGSRT